jgi:arylsulfatase A-like enzyme
LTKDAPGIPVHDSFADSRQDNPTYAAMVESLDENVGRVIDTLERLNLRENTILLFFSDNGGLIHWRNPKFRHLHSTKQSGQGMGLRRRNPRTPDH